MKRSKFSLSHYKLMSINQGLLYPCTWFEVLPGDTVQQVTSALCRVAPMAAPVMHPVHARIHHWFVPFRLIWDNWESFITGGPDGMDESEPPYYDLNAISGGGYEEVWKALDYFGVPQGVYPVGSYVSSLPQRAYNLVFNEWYRDQDLVPEVWINKGDGIDNGLTALALQSVAWEKDRFTSARPWTQKGPEVNLPLTGTVDLVASGTPKFLRPGDTLPGGGATLNSAAGTNAVSWSSPAINAGPAGWADPGLTANLGTNVAVSVNDLREAFALQRYEEARARYGSRYSEYLRYLGVRSSDARLQRPEYLGGGKQTIQFSEVLQTAEGTDPVGMLRGHGIGVTRSNRYRRFFEEHGIVLSLISVKPRTVYANMLERKFLRRTKEDYWQKELEHIGQAEIFNKEIYPTHADGNGVFGYQDRYDEYRRCESSVAGEFRTTLNYWHMAREFAAPPVLNGSFVTANPTNRIYADQTSDQLYLMINHSIQARRMISKMGTSFIY